MLTWRTANRSVCIHLNDTNPSGESTGRVTVSWFASVTAGIPSGPREGSRLEQSPGPQVAFQTVDVMVSVITKEANRLCESNNTANSSYDWWNRELDPGVFISISPPP